MTKQEKKQRIAIAAAFLRNKQKTKREADAITEKFFKDSVDPCYTIYEKFNRLRGAFDIVESMYNCSIISRELCFDLERRINGIFSEAMNELDDDDKKTRGTRGNEIHVDLG